MNKDKLRKTHCRFIEKMQNIRITVNEGCRQRKGLGSVLFIYLAAVCGLWGSVPDPGIKHVPQGSGSSESYPVDCQEFPK